ncbi:putative RNA pseudouridine synthase YhcT [Xylanibacillus composti]|uniref:Pseudouridine synthase n=2 Tax=Xylanibacillus composti TaxID=1572762 RepID=A0A8J4M2X9_9BACL|nr:putative RNA pseudouridine synthase YhcT [Xylanibacillus composti]
MKKAAVPYERRGEWAVLPASRADAAPIPDKLQKQLKSAGEWVEQAGRLHIRLFPAESLRFSPVWAAIDILYEDDFCLVANKPAGMAVHPTAPDDAAITLANAVAAHYESTGQAVRVRHIHRLDADTTGPVLYAKNPLAQHRLDEAMRQKQITRMYLALVHGRPREHKGTINAAIGRDRHHPKRRRISPAGQPAVTHFTVVESFRSAALLRLQLETGRTHQIRVHVSAQGHPILGDLLYGGKPMAGLARQALHGAQLAFPHPWTGEPIAVEAPMAADMQQALNALRGQMD